MNNPPVGLRLRPVIRPSLRVNLEPLDKLGALSLSNGQGAKRRVETFTAGIFAKVLAVKVIMNENVVFMN